MSEKSPEFAAAVHEVEAEIDNVMGAIANALVVILADIRATGDPALAAHVVARIATYIENVAGLLDVEDHFVLKLLRTSSVRKQLAETLWEHCKESDE